MGQAGTALDIAPVQGRGYSYLKRGVTMWPVKGGYSGEERTLLYLTVLRSRVYDVKFIINRIDPDAFMVVGVSQQTWGGYTQKKKKAKPMVSDYSVDS